MGEQGFDPIDQSFFEDVNTEKAKKRGFLGSAMIDGEDDGIREGADDSEADRRRKI